MRRGRWFNGSALYRSLSLLSNGGDPGARNGKPFARRDFRSFSARVFCAYKQPSRGRRTGPPNACEEETESRHPCGDPEGCADWNGPGVPRYRPCIEYNSFVVDRGSQTVWLKRPHQDPKWPDHTAYWR